MSRHLKIGIFVPDIGVPLGFEDIVSAHVQLPLHTIKLLREAGHTAHLITIQMVKGSVFPSCLPEGVLIHQLTDPKVRGDDFVMYVGPSKGIYPMRLLQMFMQLRRIIRQEEYDLVHFFGKNRLGNLVGLLGFLQRSVPLVFSFILGHLSERPWLINRHLWGRISRVITSTEFHRKAFLSRAIEAKVIRHGVVRDLSLAGQTNNNYRRNRVLFWRDPSVENGADVCIQVFSKLAPKFPEITFDFAVRPHWARVPGIKELAQKCQNVRVYEAPYPSGVSFPRLLHESILVFLPFRELSVHPQFAVLESMFAGKAVVTTAIGSNPELIVSGENGALVPVGDVNAAIKAVGDLLVNPQKALRMGKKAAEDVRRSWRWDNYLADLLDEYDSLARTR